MKKIDVIETWATELGHCIGNIEKIYEDDANNAKFCVDWMRRAAELLDLFVTDKMANPPTLEHIDALLKELEE